MAGFFVRFWSMASSGRDGRVRLKDLRGMGQPVCEMMLIVEEQIDRLEHGVDSHNCRRFLVQKHP
jgi:hypothetical protein